jgi:serine/threonine protein kinase
MIDFGLTVRVAQQVYGRIGTEQYLPVEVRESASSANPQLHTYDPAKVDIFTLGIMLFLLAFGQMPFCAAT